MSVTLLATEDTLLKEIDSHLRSERLSLITIRINPAVHTGPYESGTVFLILQEQELVRTGELTKRVRDGLGDDDVLVLCIPRPGNSADLLQMGANGIITPATKSPRHIAERILSQLILTGTVVTNNYGELRGGTATMRELYFHIEKLSPQREPVLIRGETGTGKELVAQELGKGRSKIMIPVNCAELQTELLGSELFGHEKGAFTGAVQMRKGLIAAAASGTIFLDEIGDLESHAQAALLRVLEDKKVRRIGANQSDEINTRFVFATNRNLEEDCQTGRFRPDLFERIRGITLGVAPLRERKADIPLLVEHFVQKYNDENDTHLTVPADACDCLFRYDWPGNVRELKAAVTKAAIYADERGEISSIILADATRARPVVTPRNSIEFDPSRDSWRAVHKRAQSIYFKAILAEAGGRKDIAINISGLSRGHFFATLKEIDQHQKGEDNNDNSIDPPET